ncbi:hypothetical protein AOQ88_01250 [Candidatus Riesia sp. GBBU]|nr:hypothetical protein AOQ88_01250 [Candidatus Riesia sp. GBBU]
MEILKSNDISQKGEFLINFIHRVITSCILVPFVIYIIFFFPRNLFIFSVFSISLVTFWEWSQFIYQKIIFKRFICTILFSIILLIFHLIIDFKILISNKLFIVVFSFSLIWWITSIFLIIFFPFYFKFLYESKELIFIIGTIIIFSFYFGILALKNIDSLKNNFLGTYLILYMFSLVWSFDSGSYFFGRILGKNKLIKSISPRKTFEGVIGGIITTYFVYYILEYFLPVNIFQKNFMLFIFTIIFWSIVGDLTESIFKRKFGIAESGKIIPGHGGLLDRLDSLIAVTPIFSLIVLISIEM